MLRRANDHEEAAFFLVERTVRRTRPQVGALGLKAAELPDGRIERNPLGLLRFRFDGHGSGLEPENPVVTRRVSGDEKATWTDLARMVVVAKPVVDSEWNLLSMQLGARTLRRLPLGSVVTHDPNGTPPFRGSLDLPRLGRRREPELRELEERALLHAIDVFLLEEDPVWPDPSQAPDEWKPWVVPRPFVGSRISTVLARGDRHARSKWHRCPVCHTPVVRGPFNPRIPVGTVRPGTGVIRDLRGGYLSRLRETYLLDDPKSLLEARVRLPRSATRPEPSDL